jgi:hypothetical protein
MRLAVLMVLALAGCVSLPGNGTAAITEPHSDCEAGEQMVETMLFLGMARPGGEVSETEFARFIEAEVSPRWREGYTILHGQGLWYSEQPRVTEREPNRVLVRFHDGSPSASAGIEAIRNAYVRAFMQDSVLRADRVACADF